jgi:hypothetical protein
MDTLSGAFEALISCDDKVSNKGAWPPPELVQRVE